MDAERIAELRELSDQSKAVNPDKLAGACLGEALDEIEDLIRKGKSLLDIRWQDAALSCRMCGPCAWPEKRNGLWVHLRPSIGNRGQPCMSYTPCEAPTIHDLIAAESNAEKHDE